MSSKVVNTAPQNSVPITTTPVPSGPPASVVRTVKTAEVSPNEVVVITPPVVRPALKPNSIATEPWTSFGTFDTRIFKDDFCHEKHFTGKVKASSVDGATFNLKETANLEKDNALKIKDELKLWFPLNYGPQYLHLRVKDTDTRVHYDNGITQINGDKVNLYASFGWARNLQNYNFKLGLATVFKDFNSDTRVRLTSDRNIALYEKATLRYKDLRFGLIGVLDITKQLLLKKDLLVGYKHKEWDVIVKAEQAFDKPTKDFSNFAEWFSSLSLTTTYTHNSKQKYAASVEADPAKASWLATALVEYKYNDKSLTKVAVNSAAVLSVMVKKTINNLWAVSGGAQLPLAGDKTAKNKFGVQIDLNI